MTTDLRITVHGFTATDSITHHVRARFAKLEQLGTRMTSCHVKLELPHRHQRHGAHFHVCIEMTVPGDTLVISRDPQDRTYEDLHAAIDEAFDSARRTLDAWNRVRRGDVKRHLDGAPPR